MMINPAMQDKNPELAQHLNKLSNSFERQYDLLDVQERANLYEGITEFAKVIIQGGNHASLSIMTSEDGVTQMVIQAVPNAF